jgi:hypothetical protein
MKTTYRLKYGIPLLPINSVIEFDEINGGVYHLEEGIIRDHPLRQGLAGYLWLLRKCGDKFLEEIKDAKE